MTTSRKIEIFSADCPLCTDVIEVVRKMACPSCEVEVLDVRRDEIAVRAANLGVHSVPTVAINGSLATCCTDRGVSKEALREAGVGTPLA